MTEASDKRTRRVRLALLIAAVVLTAASCIDLPEYTREGASLYLQHLGTLALLLPLAADLKLRTFTIPACVCIFLFVCLHILGARYLYSNVPYREWAERFLHWHIAADDIHGNKFDRLVHFAFGALAIPPLFQIAKRRLKIESDAAALLTAWAFVQCFSLLYEVFEWLLTTVMSPEDAEGYNGQQGDPWDAQKDMFLALAGSTATAALLAIPTLLRRFVRRGELRKE